MEHKGTVSGTIILSPTGTFGSSLTVSGTPVSLVGDQLRVRDSDSSPNVFPVTELVVTTGTLTDLGSGVVQIDTGGGGGGSATDAGDIKLIGEVFIL